MDGFNSALNTAQWYIDASPASVTQFPRLHWQVPARAIQCSTNAAAPSIDLVTFPKCEIQG
jgi:hypothetical protein